MLLLICAGLWHSILKWTVLHICVKESPPQLEVFRTLEYALWNQLLSVAAGLSVVSLLHVGHVVQQPHPNRLVHRHLEGHLFEHLTHRHLRQTRERRLASLTLTRWPWCVILFTSWKLSFLNMAMLTSLSSPIFTWNFLTPSLVTPGWGDNTLITTSHKLYDTCFPLLSFSLLTVAHHHACHLFPDAFASVTGLCENKKIHNYHRTK